MGRISIEGIRCKGCGRCITACPKDLIGFSHELNDRGYDYVIFNGSPEQRKTDAVSKTARPGSVSMRSVNRISTLSTWPL